jgi:acetyl-CoA synthetase
LEKNAKKTAIIFEADEPGMAKHISFEDLHKKVCQVANILRKMGVKRGSMVAIYLPMVPELIYSMLACARIGAIHSVIFSGFSANALFERVEQTKAEIVITQSFSHRGGRLLQLRNVVFEALEKRKAKTKILFVDDLDSGKRLERDSLFAENLKLHDSNIENFSCRDFLKNEDSPCEAMPSMAPLFVLHTSGSTGTPKGIVHGSGGYLMYVSLTHQLVFDIKPDDIYFCTADIGWITGHSYSVYGPLSNCTTIVLFQGIPTYPNSYRFWNIIDEHKVSVFYTAPTALRSLMKTNVKVADTFSGGHSFRGENDLLNGRENEEVKKSETGEGFGRAGEGGETRGTENVVSLRSLRILASVGEPIDPKTWQWFYSEIGREKCPVMDTWWQTETGGILICPLIQKFGQKAGCAAKPFPGITPVLVNYTQEKGSQLLCVKGSWPGQLIGILNDREYFDKYFLPDVAGGKGYVEGQSPTSELNSSNDVLPPGSIRYYASGDGAKIDMDGDIWILGRLDDVLNVSGHRINAIEVEKAAVSLEGVIEACVVGFPHEIKGEGIFVFAVFKGVIDESSTVLLKSHIRKVIGPIATPDRVLIVDDLPKTRSGKIIRRLLRKIAAGRDISGEDMSSIANKECLDSINKRYEVYRSNSADR